MSTYSSSLQIPIYLLSWFKITPFEAASKALVQQNTLLTTNFDSKLLDCELVFVLTTNEA